MWDWSSVLDRAIKSAELAGYDVRQHRDGSWDLRRGGRAHTFPEVGERFSERREFLFWLHRLGVNLKGVV